jgi:hypothetical protein
MEKNYKLDSALDLVKRDALEQVQYHRIRLADKPLSGWSQEQHEQYHNERIEKGLLVDKWCFTRMMQIDPD